MVGLIALIDHFEDFQKIADLAPELLLIFRQAFEPIEELATTRFD